jgi:DNA-binding MarR family transcriptional regulator
MERRQALFGSRKQTLVLMLVSLLEETYSREIARLTPADPASVSRYLDKLESGGIVVSRYIGKERRVSINPRFVARKELAALVEKLTSAEPELMERVRLLRRRPRRRGKEI